MYLDKETERKFAFFEVQIDSRIKFTTLNMQWIYACTVALLFSESYKIAYTI